MALGYRKDGTKLGFQKGHSVSLETRRKIGLANSIALKGRKIPKEIKLKMFGRIPWNKGKKMPQISGKNHPMYGKKHSVESKRKMSDKLRGHIPWNKGLNGWNKGHYVSEETKQKIREKRHLRKQKLGYINAPEIRYKFGLGNRKGEKARNWQGGKSSEPYTPLFSQQLKDKIRVRDNFICQLCGVPELECNRKLQIHHIDYDKKNSDDSNLIALCIRCHMKTNGKRNYWKDYFTKIRSLI
ncbi:MAG: NUMOD3 domain-containing DNA-binding protein [Candidatus Omnitrophota bacterium]|jgi:5-methylcytosine-specific restriction endonuclease McrA